MTTYNWGILGTGTIASEFATMLREKDSTIYSVGSRTQAKADDFANQHGVTYAHGSYDSFFFKMNKLILFILQHLIQTIMNLSKEVYSRESMFCVKRQLRLMELS